MVRGPWQQRRLPSKELRWFLRPQRLPLCKTHHQTQQQPLRPFQSRTRGPAFAIAMLSLVSLQPGLRPQKSLLVFRSSIQNSPHRSDRVRRGTIFIFSDTAPDAVPQDAELPRNVVFTVKRHQKPPLLMIWRCQNCKLVIAVLIPFCGPIRDGIPHQRPSKSRADAKIAEPVAGMFPCT